jgi:hypothetical protein
MMKFIVKKSFDLTGIRCWSGVLAIYTTKAFSYKVNLAANTPAWQLRYPGSNPVQVK